MHLIDMRDKKIADGLYINHWRNVHDEEGPFSDTMISFEGKLYYLTQTYGGWSIAENPANHKDALLIDCLGEEALRTLYEESIGREGHDGRVSVFEDEEDLEIEIDD